MLECLSKHRAFAAHTAAWCIYLCAPFFIMSFTQFEITDGNWYGLLIPPLFVMLVFYANYLVYVNRFLMRKQLTGFILCNIITVAAAMLSLHFIMNMLNGPQMMMPPPDNMPPAPPRPGPPPGLPPRPLFGLRFSDIIIYVLAVGVGTAIRMTEKWYKSEQTRKELEHERAIAELQSLKNQLNPHFLFNTLNNIYSFIRTDAAQAQRTMDELCQLLRYVLYECDKHTVKLSDELDFVGNYIELMRVRMPQNAKLTISWPEAIPDYDIAPCLFIMLIENAFKHGARNHPDSMISIGIKIEDGKLIGKIENSCTPESFENEEISNGIGLENLHRRLNLLYPGHYSLECGRDGNIYRAYLYIDLQYQLSV